MLSGNRSFVVAIDGPAAAGKGTLARRIADHFGFAYLDTGLLYRAVGYKAVASGADVEDETAATAIAQSLQAGDLESEALRSDVAAVAASRVAALPAVRQALLDFQRRFAVQPPGGAPGAVLDGRDIGSVVCPGADIKLFVTASLDERARRRVKELRQRGIEVKEERVLEDMRERDARDASRSIAPLEPVDEATIIDSSGLDTDAVFRLALSAIANRTSGT